MLASRCRCPGCGYELSGQPGAPARSYGPFTADARCPECALEIPEGSLCIVGGASGRVVDPNGALSAWAGMAAAFGALALIPLVAWTSMLIAAPRLAHAANACAAVAALGVVVVGGWFLWRH